MNGGFSLIGLVVWVLILAGIFWIARITPWLPASEDRRELVHRPLEVSQE